MVRASVASLFVSFVALGAGAPAGNAPSHSAGPPRGEALVAERGASNGADFCIDAPSIAGSGLFPFDNSNATTDGQAHPDLCNFFGEPQISRDLWWRWTANCDGVVTIETCGLAEFDTEMAVYSPLALCSPSSAYLVACNDDACDIRSRVSFVAIAGQEYLIRVGSYIQASAGLGSFQITCSENTVCSGDAALCQEVDYGELAYTSQSTFFRIADDFSPAASGSISSLCWSGGTYFGGTDDFRVVYYRDAGGYPGLPIAAFSQSGGSLNVRRTLTGLIVPEGLPESEYGACHPPVPVSRGERYWVEIRNFTTDSYWYWSSSPGAGASFQDYTPLDGDWAGATVIPDRALCIGLNSECPNDTNGDGLVNFADLNNIISNFNTSCP